MKRRYFFLLTCVFGWILFAGLPLAPAQEVPTENKKPSKEFPSLKFGSQISGPTSDIGGRDKIAFSGEFKITEGGRDGTVSITAVLAPPDWHTYALSQKGGPGPSELTVKDSADFKVVGPFQPNRDPKERTPLGPDGKPIWDGPVFEHYDEVIWSAPIKLSEGVDPAKLTIKIKYDGQACSDAEGTCKPTIKTVEATFAGYFEPKETGYVGPKDQPSGEYRASGSHVVIKGHIEPQNVAPGGKVRLVITAVPDDQFHIYAFADKDPKKSGLNKPTLIALTKKSGWAAKRPVASSEEIPDPSNTPHHEGEVTWTIGLQVPDDAEPATYAISGLIGYQVCTPKTCDLPTAAEFTVAVTVGAGEMAGKVPLSFSEFNSYRKVAKEAESMQWEGPAKTQWDGLPVAAIFGLAFLAGLILNVMPCVLPVIGLKIMSFVQQAGGNRFEILSLNAWFSAGLMSVFMVLATAAVFMNLGWGEHFGSFVFTVTMISIVFVFGLSFFGVWEIPIPGFVGSGKANEIAAKEGAAGAFSKGILTTILATPCSGPLLVPAVSWAIAQPAWLTYTTFLCIGLGMATPYLLIGAFPALINMLPKPGAWMNTFKQTMGFVLMGTVVFLFSSLEHKYVIPTLTLLVGLSVGCWWIGRTPLTAELNDKVRAWAYGSFMAGLIGLFAFGWLLNPHELEWEPYTRAVLDEHRKAGNTVLVDFTADW